MFIKHDAFMDVCIEVRTINPDNGGYKVYGSFWNLGQSGKSFSIGEDLRLKITKENILAWKMCKDAGEDLRKAEWIPLSL